MKLCTVEEIYNREYIRAWYYYSTDNISDRTLSHYSNVFAVKNTWEAYNKHIVKYAKFQEAKTPN